MKVAAQEASDKTPDAGGPRGGREGMQAPHPPTLPSSFTQDTFIARSRDRLTLLATTTNDAKLELGIFFLCFGVGSTGHENWWGKRDCRSRTVRFSCERWFIFK